MEVITSRVAQVGRLEVHRALPTRGHRTVGAWCFADHFGPAQVAPGSGADIGPHPHMGLHTVTWLMAGELVHRDSLGSEQIIRPGQLNLMTAGHGVAHAEEGTKQYAGDIHGVQLWVAQPAATRDGPAAFEHHSALPVAEFGSARATVMVGELGPAASPARRDSDLVGAELVIGTGRATLPLDRGFEYAMVPLSGSARALDTELLLHSLAHLGQGHDELTITSTGTSRMLLLGGVPFPEQVLMWWNFVARSRDEIVAARRQWMDDDGRFGSVESSLERIEVGPPPWTGGR